MLFFLSSATDFVEFHSSHLFFFDITVYGLKLRASLDLWKSLPSEAFFNLLMRKKAALASVENSEVVVREGRRGEPVDDVTTTDLAVGTGGKTTVLPRDKDKEKKRHRDGTSYRSHHHHHKESKDAARVVILDESDKASKLGLEMSK